MPRYRSVAAPDRAISPSQAAHQWAKLVEEIDGLRQQLRNQVLSGLLAGTPTSASTQAAGVGNTDWNVNVAAGIVVVGGVITEFAAQADYDVHSGSLFTGLTSGSSVISALVCRNISGTVTMTVVDGTAATTGSQVAPTDAAITTALGATVGSWVELAELTLNRTGNTTVTQSQNNTRRPVLAVTTDSAWGDWSDFAAS